MDNIPDIVFTDPEFNSYFSFLAPETPDLNGDGYDDVVVGGHRAMTDGVPTGAVFVFFGAEDMDNVSDLRLTDNVTNGLFGQYLSGAGDLNGDGFEDLVVGDDEYITDPVGAGKAYIYYGGTDFDDEADLVLTGTAPGECFTVDISAAEKKSCSIFLLQEQCIRQEPSAVILSRRPLATPY